MQKNKKYGFRNTMAFQSKSIYTQFYFPDKAKSTSPGALEIGGKT